MKKVSLIRKDGRGVALGVCNKEGKIVKIFGKFNSFEDTDEYAHSNYDIVYDNGKRYFEEFEKLNLPPLYKREYK